MIPDGIAGPEQEPFEDGGTRQENSEVKVESPARSFAALIRRRSRHEEWHSNQGENAAA